MKSTRLRVAVVGATGLAGQQFLAALEHHPWFEVTLLAASARSAGKTYRDAISVGGQVQWYAQTALPDSFASMMVQDAEQLDASAVDVVFTAIDAAPARELEPRYAQHVPVISTASAFRYEDDVPLLLPGLNEGHSALLTEQTKRRGWKGFIAPNPNCTTVGLAYSLAPLMKFGLRRVHMVSMQSMSGAGRSPGVIGMDIIDNLIPYIAKEEGKVELETKKILGRFAGGASAITPATFDVTCTCTRVGVIEGHTEAVHLELDQAPTEEEIIAAWEGFGREYVTRGLPTAPPELLVVRRDPYRPQPRLDRDTHGGMATVIGRLRKDDHIANLYKYVLVSHNTKMGAAKGCILMAEQLKQAGVI